MKQYLTVILSLLVFVACDKSLDQLEIEYETVGLTDKIEISEVEADYSEITEVAFVARFHGFGGPGSTLDVDGKDTRVMLKVPFNSGNTMLILPENPPQELLCDITSDFPNGFEISDPGAKTIAFVEIACDISDDDKFSRFLYMTLNTGDIQYKLEYVYCDRAVNIVGTGKDWWNHPAVYDLSLEKGWNMVVEKREYVGDVQKCFVSNQMPVGMKWKQNMWIGER